MRDISPVLIVGCGSALICTIALILVGMSAFRFSARFAFLLPVITTVIGFFTKRQDEGENAQYEQQRMNITPRQPAQDIRARTQAYDFDAAVDYYRQQNSPNQPYSPAQQAPPTLPFTSQNAPLVPNSPNLDSPAIQPGIQPGLPPYTTPGQPTQPTQSTRPGQPTQPLSPQMPRQTPPPLRPTGQPAAPGTGGPAAPPPSNPSLADDDLERYSLRSRFPRDRPIYGNNRRSRQQADENEDFLAGLLGSEEEAMDDGDGGLF